MVGKMSKKTDTNPIVPPTPTPTPPPWVSKTTPTTPTAPVAKTGTVPPWATGKTTTTPKTPALPATPNAKLSSNDILAVFQGITERGAPYAAKQAKKDEEAWKKTFWASDAWNGVLNFGQSVINAYATPLAGAQGGAVATGKKPLDTSKWTMDEQIAYAQTGTIPKRTGIKQPNQIEDIAKWTAGASKNIDDLWSGKTIKTGKDVLEANGISTTGAAQIPIAIKRDNPLGKFFSDAFLQGQEIDSSINAAELGMDIIQDPLLLVNPAGVAAKVLGAAKTAGVIATKTAKTAITTGQISKNVVLADLAKVAEQTGKKVTDKQLKSVKGTKLKPWSQTFDQYTNKSLIKVEDQAGKTFNELKNKIDAKYTYETAWGDANVRNIVASSFEAAGKAFMARLLTKVAIKDIKTESGALRKAAVKEMKTTEKLSRATQTLDNLEVETTAPAQAAPAQAAPAVPPVEPTAIVNGEPKQILPFEMHISGKTTYVMDEDKIVHEFTSQKSAKAFIKASTTTEEAIKPAVKADRMIIDSNPNLLPQPTPVASKAITASADEAQKVMKNVSAILKKTTGIVQSKNTISRVLDVLREAENVRSTVRNLDARLRAAIQQVVSKNASPLNALKSWASGTLGGDYVQVARELAQKTVLLDDGRTVQLGSIVMGKKAIEGYSTDVQKQIYAHFKNFLNAGTATEAQYIAQLTEIVGKEVAERIAKTGFLSGKKYDAEAMQQILDDLPKMGTQKKYANILEFAQGLKNGDVVENDAIVAVLKAIDPEAKEIKNIEKVLATPDAHAQLRGMIIGKGVRTVEGMSLVMKRANPERIMESTGIAFSDAHAAYIVAREMSDVLPPPAVLDNVRAAAVENLTRDLGSTNPDTVDSINYVIRAVSRGLDRSFEYFNEIKNSPNFLEGLSDSKQMAARNTEKAYQAETKAMLTRQLNQSFEARADGELFGLIRKRHSSKKVGKTTVDLIANQEAMLDDFIIDGARMNDTILAVLGTRLIYTKPLIEGESHFIYFSMADFARIMSKMGQNQKSLAAKALFADLAGVSAKNIDPMKQSTLSTIGIGQAVRTAIEQFETKGQIVREDIVKLLQSRASTQTKLSAKKTAENNALAEQIADEILKPKFLEEVKNVHNLRASAATEDFLNVADTLSADLFTSLFKGWELNRAMGVDNAGTRAQLAREWFNKFAYESGIFAQQGGEQAQAVFLAASHIFTVGGKLKKLADETEAAWLLGSPNPKAGAENNALYNEVMELIHSVYKHDNANFGIGEGRQHLPIPTERSRGAAITKYTEAKLAFEAIIDEAANITGKAAQMAWDKRFKAASTRLDKARIKAWENSVPTEHWDGIEWVPSERFNYEEALANAMEEAAKATPEGIIRHTPAVDSIPTIPKHKVLTAAESKKVIAKLRKENNARNIERVKGFIQEADEKVANSIDQIEASMDAEGMNPFEKLEALEDIRNSLSLKESELFIEDLPITEMHGALSYKDVKALKQRSTPLEPLTGTFLREAVQGATDVPIPTRMGRQDVARMRPNLAPMQAKAEVTLGTQRSTVARYFNQLHKKYAARHLVNGKWEAVLSTEEVLKAFQAAISKSKNLSKMSPEMRDLTIRVRNTISAVMNTPESGRTLGIDPDLMKSALAKEGLNQIAGVVHTGLMNTDDLAKLFSEAPFAKMPSYIKKGTPEAKQWAENAKKFANGAENPFTYTQKVLNAVQYANSMTQFVSEFHIRFGWKDGVQSYPNMQAALKDGYVAIKGTGGESGMDLTKLLPTPEDGGLYHPDMAEEFLSQHREIERLMYGGQVANKKLASFIRSAMAAQDFFKVMQTILRPGHHLVNITSEHVWALMRGTTDPRDWARAYNFGLTFMADDLKAKWFGGKLDTHYENMVRAQGYGSQKISAASGNDLNTVTFALRKDGKTKAMRLSKQDIVDLFRAQGVAIENIHVSDMQMLFDNVITDSTSTTLATKATIKEKTGAWAREGAQWIEKYPGSIASWYSNIPRMATAIDVIESRTWNSVEEAVSAAFAEVNKYHPTTYSLSATQRKFVRPAFAYYTWIRGIHNASIDLLLNHAAVVTLPSKIQYNQEVQQGIQPTSFGNPFPQNNDIPNYIDYSVYGPTYGIYGQPMVYKFSNPLLDNLDMYKLKYDPAYDPGENIFMQGGVVDTAATLLSSSMNYSAKPLVGLAAGNVDPSTGRETPVKDFESFADATLSNVAYWNLYKSTGGLTFTQNKEKNLLVAQGMDPKAAEIAVGYNQIEKTSFLQNWLYGRRGQIIFGSGNVKNAKFENADRLKAIERQIQLGRTE